MRSGGVKDTEGGLKEESGQVKKVELQQVMG